MMDLPSASDSRLELVHPTEEQRLKQLHSNGAVWKGALSLEAYIQREAHLAAQDFGKGLQSWALVNGDRLLCACETFRKRALVSENGNVQEIVAHGIGSVFCPPENRGRGYAGRLMTEIGAVLDGISILYSDIGRDFYARYGWKPYPSSHISLQARAGPLQSIKLLYADDLAELCLADEEQLRNDMKLTDGFALIPDIQTIKWHHAREEFVGSQLLKTSPEIKGASVGGAWCYWTRMWYNHDPTSTAENTLHILRMVPTDAVSVKALLEAAVQQADEWLCETVEIWNPSAVTLEAARMLESTIQVVDRETESICSLRGGDMRWIGNEKYGWC